MWLTRMVVPVIIHLSSDLASFWFFFRAEPKPPFFGSLPALPPVLTSPANRTILGTEARVTFHLDSSSNAGNGAAVPPSSSPPGAAFSFGDRPRSLCFLPPRAAAKAPRVPSRAS